MSKITALSSILIDKFGLSQKESEAFVVAMFDVIKDSIQQGERTVKVKRLGTFKITSVSSRESIDINSGERITIEARNKISFTPETALRDRVNKPFAQFETVDINEGVDFADLENDTVSEEKEESIVSEKQEEDSTQIAISHPDDKKNEGKKQREETPQIAISQPDDKKHNREKQEEHNQPEHISQHNDNKYGGGVMLNYKFKKKIWRRNVIITVLSIVLFLFLGATVYSLKIYNVELQKRVDRISELEIIIDSQRALKAENDSSATTNDSIVSVKEAATNDKKGDAKNPKTSLQQPDKTSSNAPKAVIQQQNKTSSNAPKAAIQQQDKTSSNDPKAVIDA